MTNLLEIKPYIKTFIEDKLDDVFANKVYWIGERVNVPTYPYCLLSVIAESKDKRTSHHGYKLIKNPKSDYFCLNSPDLNRECLFAFPDSDISDVILRQSITTRYKTCTITVGVYNAWVEDVYDTDDMDVTKEFAYEQIDLLEGAFEDYPINKKFSVQNISPIRPLPEVVPGGYMYRYEFDLTIGYNEPCINDKKLGRKINVETVDTNEANTSIIDGELVIKGDDYINTNFQVTMNNNGNIDIETI